VTKRIGSLSTVFAIAVLAGCGDSRTPRFNVSGSITLDGKPVPSGHLIFAPDADHGARGPAGTAEIVDGRYATLDGEGTIGGPHVVTITATDGVSYDMGGGHMNPVGRQLAPEFRVRVDLPKEPTTHDFVLPPE